MGTFQAGLQSSGGEPLGFRGFTLRPALVEGDLQRLGDGALRVSARRGTFDLFALGLINVHLICLSPYL